MMEEHRCITREDLLVTEARISGSYNRLKVSIQQTPSMVLRSASRTVAEHPLAATGTVAMGAMLGTIILGKLQPHIIKDKNGDENKAGSRPDLAGRILSVVLPLAIPCIEKFIGDSLGSIPAGSGQRTYYD